MNDEEIKTPVVLPGQLSEEELARRDEWAQFRLGLISSVVFHTHDMRSDRQELIRIAGKSHTLPDGRQKKYSYETLSRWVRDYRERGICALWVKTRSDCGESRILNGTVIIRITEIMAQVPTITMAKLGRRLVKEGLLKEGDVSDDTLRRFVKNHDFKNPAALEERIRRSFIVAESGYLWESDSLYFIKLQRDGKLRWVFVQAILDNHSRMILAAKCYWHDNARNFQNTFRYSVGRYHIPVKLYVDNGSPFIDRQLVAICNRLGVTLIHTRSNDGASKGVVERNWLSMLIDTIPDIILDNVDTIEGVQNIVDDYVGFYNTKVNTGVGGIPVERYKESGKRIVLRKVDSAKSLSRLFMNEASHFVYNDNTIRKWKKKWEIPDELVVQLHKDKVRYVTVYYDPNNGEQTLHVVYQEKEYLLAPHDPEANDGKKRNTGGRTTELAEREKEKREVEMSLAERRAEERYAKRMAGVDPRYLVDAQDLPYPEMPETSDPGGNLVLDYAKEN